MSLIRPLSVGIVLAALAWPASAYAGPNAGAYGFFLSKQPVPINNTSSAYPLKSANTPLQNQSLRRLDAPRFNLPGGGLGGGSAVRVR
jgi:hypothetical protein